MWLKRLVAVVLVISIVTIAGLIVAGLVKGSGQ